MATKGTKFTKERIWILIILCVPARIAVAVDWENLELLPGSFIDPRFRAHESDPLFAAPLAGGEARFYLLFEHQTAEDKVIALRLMRHMVSIWEKHLAESPGDSPVVILPVVLAQNDREWKLRPPPSFQSVFFPQFVPPGGCFWLPAADFIPSSLSFHNPRLKSPHDPRAIG